MWDTFKSFMGSPETQEAKIAAFLLAIVAMLLGTPALYRNISVYLWPYIVNEWGVDLAVVVWIALWAILIPLFFVLAKNSFSNSYAMLLVFFADKFI